VFTRLVKDRLGADAAEQANGQPSVAPVTTSSSIRPTSSPVVCRPVRLLRSHGMTTLTWDRHRGHAADYDVTTRGFNFRLDEVRATIGLVQLERLAAENKARKRIVACYRSRLADTSLVLPFAAHTEDLQPSFHLAVVVFSIARAA
jgi:dTDP-4-amino-4,6-dideoxygalactose transaminase